MRLSGARAPSDLVEEDVALLGARDPFRDMAPDAAGSWVATLDQRAAAPDQRRMRGRMITLARLHGGDRAVEVGCGTGALLQELAEAVGSTGRVTGVDPQPAFVEAARQRVRDAGLSDRADAVVGGIEDVPLPDSSVDAALAQTVLIHLPPATLAAGLSRLRRLVRPGGWVVSADQDADTWTIDHSDRDLTRTLVMFNTDQRNADGWTGRRLRHLFRDAELRDVAVEVAVHVDTAADSYLLGMALRIARAAADAGVISPSQAEGWGGELRERAASGDFFSSLNTYLCCGRR